MFPATHCVLTPADIAMPFGTTSLNSLTQLTVKSAQTTCNRSASAKHVFAPSIENIAEL